MKTEKIKEKYLHYGLEKDDVFKHQHYVIITRSGSISYECIKCEPNFAAVKATATKEGNTIETFGSALKGSTFKDGNTNSWYCLEMAQKRSFSRAVLQLTGMYELGCFGEDESEEFKQK